MRCALARRAAAVASPAAGALGAAESAKLEWRAASGKGTLYTFAIMHQVMNPGFAGQTPYNVSQVDLAEGVRMVSNVIGIASDALKIGMALEAVFDDVGDGVHVPKFRPVTGECA